MIEGVAGVVIWTSELMKMVEFYQGKLGLEPHSIKPDFVSFKWGQMRLGLGIHGQVLQDWWYRKTLQDYNNDWPPWFANRNWRLWNPPRYSS